MTSSNTWIPSTATAAGGRIAVIITKPGYAPVDVTHFRGVPLQIDNLDEADPFGDSTAVFTFPQVTAFDDFDSADVGAWLGEDSDVDVYWIPAALPSSLPVLTGAYADDAQTYINPLTQQQDLVAPMWNYDLHGNRTTRHGRKIFEGFIASIESSGDERGNSLQLQCVGALFQADCYLAKPFFPPRPQSLESLISDVFDHTLQPHLRTGPLAVAFPVGWTKVGPAYPAAGPNMYTPSVTPGQKWTGYDSRSTGSWDHALTGFVQNQLQSMITDGESGVREGNQWTVMQAREGDSTHPGGRTPVLQVRDRFRAPDFSMWVNQHGLTHQLTKDSTQVIDLIYGSGTGTDGTGWSNSVVSSDGSRTDYVPLAFRREDYPYQGNPSLNLSKVVRESYLQYGTGFDQVNAITSAQQSLIREASPGWSGTLTLATDPSSSMSRWEIHAGMTICLQGFAGTGATGLNLHIAAVERSITQGTVQLTVDTRYRDLLTLATAIARTRDPLTPFRQLKAGQASQIAEDVMAPWDYTAGSGFIPKASTAFFAHKPVTSDFPYADWTKAYPPSAHPEFYVTCHANANTRDKRWAGAIPILTAEKGTIRRSEFLAVDVHGNPLAVYFHVSLYYNNVNVSFMPYDGNGHSPFLPGAFSKVNPGTGQPWSQPNLLPDNSFIVGWGAGTPGQSAGFWPGLATLGSPETGLLVDEGTWSFDNTNNGRFNVNAKPGQTQNAGANPVTIYAMFYSEAPQTVYFLGRLFRQEPGTG